MFIPLTGHRLISSWSVKQQAVTSPSKAPRRIGRVARKPHGGWGETFDILTRETDFQEVGGLRYLKICFQALSSSLFPLVFARLLFHFSRAFPLVCTDREPGKDYHTRHTDTASLEFSCKLLRFTPHTFVLTLMCPLPP